MPVAKSVCAISNITWHVVHFSLYQEVFTGGTTLDSPHNHSIAGSKPAPAVFSDFGEGKSQLAGLAAGWFATVKTL